MSSVQKLFFTLEKRLSFFLDKGELVRYKTFHYQKVIEGIEECILDLPPKQAEKKLSSLLRKVKKLKRTGADFSQYFYDSYNLEREDIANQFDLPLEYVRVFPTPMADPVEMQTVHQQIVKELDDYRTFIEKTLRRFEEDEEDEISHVFSYRGDETELTDILKTLQKVSLVDKTITPALFKQVFTGGKPPKQKVVWTGAAPQLNEFIKQLHKRNLVVNTKKEKWNITKACFEFGDETKDINTVGDQSLRDNEAIKLINDILKPYENYCL